MQWLSVKLAYLYVKYSSGVAILIWALRHLNNNMQNFQRLARVFFIRFMKSNPSLHAHITHTCTHKHRGSTQVEKIMCPYWSGINWGLQPGRWPTTDQKCFVHSWILRGIIPFSERIGYGTRASTHTRPHYSYEFVSLGTVADVMTSLLHDIIMVHFGPVSPSNRGSSKNQGIPDPCLGTSTPRVPQCLFILKRLLCPCWDIPQAADQSKITACSHSKGL